MTWNITGIRCLLNLQSASRSRPAAATPVESLPAEEEEAGAWQGTSGFRQGDSAEKKQKQDSQQSSLESSPSSVLDTNRYRQNSSSSSDKAASGVGHDQNVSSSRSDFKHRSGHGADDSGPSNGKHVESQPPGVDEPEHDLWEAYHHGNGTTMKAALEAYIGKPMGSVSYDSAKVCGQTYEEFKAAAAAARELKQAADQAAWDAVKDTFEGPPVSPLDCHPSCCAYYPDDFMVACASEEEASRAIRGVPNAKWGISQEEEHAAALDIMLPMLFIERGLGKLVCCPFTKVAPTFENSCDFVINTAVFEPTALSK